MARGASRLFFAPSRAIFPGRYSTWPMPSNAASASLPRYACAMTVSKDMCRCIDAGAAGAPTGCICKCICCAMPAAMVLNEAEGVICCMDGGPISAYESTRGTMPESTRGLSLIHISEPTRPY